MDPALQGRALAQLDRALDRGLALILRQRMSALPCDTAWETVRLLGPVIDRAARDRDADLATTLRTEIAKGVEGFDATTAISAIDSLFPCP